MPRLLTHYDPKPVERTMDSFWKRMDEKYGAFRVQRYSRAQGQFISVGKVHPTIAAAMESAKRIERRTGGMTFIDVANRSKEGR